MSRVTITSVARNADFGRRLFSTLPVPRDTWRAGDFVVARVEGRPSPLYRIELPTGRMVEATPGDLLLGALGDRAATLEAVGSWRAVGADGRMHALTGAGLFGLITSMSRVLPPPMSLSYSGHVHRDGERMGMDDFVTAVPPSALTKPVVLIIGTSMSAGKTASARTIVRRLCAMGKRVCGAKLTGAARFRDVLTMADAGADDIFDFVDVGLPSTVCDPKDYRMRLRSLLARIEATDCEVLVAEAGASPLEPYNGDTALEVLGGAARFVVLAASDPYAVVGVIQAFGVRPDLVTGVATGTSAGRALIEKLTGIPALDLLKAEAHDALDRVLAERLGL